MPIAFTCKHCGREYDLPDMAGGRKGKCECGAVLVVPSTPAGPGHASSPSSGLAAGEALADERLELAEPSGESAEDSGDALPTAPLGNPAPQPASVKKAPRTLGEAARMAAVKRKPAPKLEWPAEPTPPSASPQIASPPAASAMVASTKGEPSRVEPPPLPPDAFGSGRGKPPEPPTGTGYAEPDDGSDNGPSVVPAPTARVLAGKYGKLREYSQRLSFVADLVFWLSLCTAVLQVTVGAWVATHTEPYAIVGSTILAGLTLAVGYGVSLGMKALAQFFHVVMDIEENTRDTALRARRM